MRFQNRKRKKKKNGMNSFNDRERIFEKVNENGHKFRLEKRKQSNMNT